MKKLTSEKMQLLKQFAAELKSVICDDQDYEGASIKRIIDDYVEVKCNPSNSIKEKTVYHCKTSTNSVAFLSECYNNGIFFIMTDTRTALPIDKVIDTIDSYEEMEFILSFDGDMVFMGSELKKGRESWSVVEYTATKEV